MCDMNSNCRLLFSIQWHQRWKFELSQSTHPQWFFTISIKLEIPYVKKVLNSEAMIYG